MIKINCINDFDQPYQEEKQCMRVNVRELWNENAVAGAGKRPWVIIWKRKNMKLGYSKRKTRMHKLITF